MFLSMWQDILQTYYVCVFQYQMMKHTCTQTQNIEFTWYGLVKYQRQNTINLTGCFQSRHYHWFLQIHHVRPLWTAVKLAAISQQLKPQSHRIDDSLIARLVAIWSATTDRQCLLRSPFTVASCGLLFTIGFRSYANLHDNLCTFTFCPEVGRFNVN